MNTTQIFVEQIFIGLILLVTLLLPIYPEMAPTIAKLYDWGNPLGLSLAAFVLGVAYLLGIVVDRAADTLFEAIEQHNRLRFALKQGDLSDFGCTHCWTDPYPEADLRARALIKGGDFQRWLDYLRARIRLSRALALFLPGLTFSLVVLAVRTRFDSVCWILDSGHFLVSAVCPVMQQLFGDTRNAEFGYIGIAFLFFCYALARALQMILALIDPARGSDKATNEHDPSIEGDPKLKAFFGVWSPPRTDKRAARTYGRKRKIIGAAKGVRPRSALWDILFNPLLWALASLTYVTYFLARLYAPAPLDYLAALSAALTLMSGWAWWRMTQTFMTYVARFDA